MNTIVMMVVIATTVLIDKRKKKTVFRTHTEQNKEKNKLRIEKEQSFLLFV